MSENYFVVSAWGGVLQKVLLPFLSEKQAGEIELSIHHKFKNSHMKSGM